MRKRVIMMISVRMKTFETNSSSVHTLSIVSPEDYDRFTNGELWYVRWGFSCEEHKPLMSTEEILSAVSDTVYDEGNDEKTIRILHDDEEIATYDELLNGGLDYYAMTETAPKGGEEFVVFGTYGRDG